MTKIVRLAQIHDSSADAQLDSSIQGGVVSIGNFDGVHRGHVALLAQVKQLASELNGPTVVVVFDPHPAAILRPGHLPPRLTWIERRADLLNKVGIDFLLVCETTTDLLGLSAKTFFQALIVDRLKAKGMVEGPNFFFGRGRSGNVETLAELCNNSGMKFIVAESINKTGDGSELDDQMISSTRIRKLLAESKIDEAIEMLGTTYRIRGQVIAGEKRGRKIGFPTANLNNIDVVVPSPGVYGGIAYIDGGSHIAAIHIGPNPTFSDDETAKVEVHVLDYAGDLYEKTIMVDFVTYVRGVARFDSTEQLKTQLHKDISTIRTRVNSFRDRDADTDSNQQQN